MYCKKYMENMKYTATYIFNLNIKSYFSSFNIDYYYKISNIITIIE